MENCSRLANAVYGSLRAVLTAWLWGAAPWALFWLVGFPYALLYMFPYVAFTWLLVCLPLYYCVPNRSILWNKWVCMTCGAFCGPLMLWFIPMVVTSWIPQASRIFVGSLFASATTQSGPDTWGRDMSTLFILTAILTGIIACGNACMHHEKYSIPEEQEQ
jgi:hypothetical protein